MGGVDFLPFIRGPRDPSKGEKGQIKLAAGGGAAAEAKKSPKAEAKAEAPAAAAAAAAPASPAAELSPAAAAIVAKITAKVRHGEVWGVESGGMISEERGRGSSFGAASGSLAFGDCLHCHECCD